MTKQLTTVVCLLLVAGCMNSRQQAQIIESTGGDKETQAAASGPPPIPYSVGKRKWQPAGYELVMIIVKKGVSESQVRELHPHIVNRFGTNSHINYYDGAIGLDNLIATEGMPSTRNGMNLLWIKVVTKVIPYQVAESKQLPVYCTQP